MGFIIERHFPFKSAFKAKLKGENSAVRLDFCSKRSLLTIHAGIGFCVTYLTSFPTNEV